MLSTCICENPSPTYILSLSLLAFTFGIPNVRLTYSAFTAFQNIGQGFNILVIVQQMHLHIIPFKTAPNLVINVMFSNVNHYKDTIHIVVFYCIVLTYSL